MALPPASGCSCSAFRCSPCRARRADLESIITRSGEQGRLQGAITSLGSVATIIGPFVFSQTLPGSSGAAPLHLPGAFVLGPSAVPWLHPRLASHQRGLAMPGSTFADGRRTCQPRHDLVMPNPAPD